MFEDKKIIEENLKAVTNMIPEGKKGALVIYGNRNEIYSTVATRIGGSTDFIFENHIKIGDHHKVDVDWFAGIKSTW